MPTDSATKLKECLRSFFSYGFRPFFFLAGLWAIVPMTVVAWALTTGLWPSGAIALLTWHGHEMIFGFAVAAIAGFLLTAVPSWTDTPAVFGYRLAALAALWLLGRIASAPFFDPGSFYTQLFTVAFIPMLAITVAAPLVSRRNFRNLPFLLGLALLFAAELLFQAPRFGWIEASPVDALRMAVNTIMLFIVVVGGRIVPAFTRNTFKAMGRPVSITSVRWVDFFAIAASAGVLIGDLVAKDAMATGWVACVAAVLLTIRLGGWHGWRTLDTPLLCVLHLGYCWLILSLALKAAWLLGGFSWTINWMHALTIGAFGTMILAVTTRAALGHTGRSLSASKPVVAAYLLVSVAAATRVWGPLLAPSRYLDVIAVAIALWVTAYTVFLIVFGPILFGPRADAESG